MPLRRSGWQGYLDWATEAFRLTASGVRDETQIHTHMCYSEFTDIIPAFVIGIPVLFWLGALIMNKIKGMHIQRRNALTLGWLISCVTMLWLMGTYS